MTNQLFANNMEINNITSGANQLSVTAQLNTVANQIVKDVLNRILPTEENDNNEEYADQILASQTDHNAMDNLLNEVVDYEAQDIDWLKEADSEELEKVLKSQQSKRSRSKNQQMTIENYAKMMTAAVAERLVREALGKPKGNGGGNTRGQATYTDEELNALAEDPAMLARAIRNVQSKKSIAKSKVDFDENSDRWQDLLEAEQQLKDLRSSINGLQNTAAQEAIEAKRKAEELVGDVDVNTLKADEARDMLAKIQEALAGQQWF